MLILPETRLSPCVFHLLTHSHLEESQEVAFSFYIQLSEFFFSEII